MLSSCVANEKSEPQLCEIWYNLAPVKQNTATKANFSEYSGTFGTFAYKFEAGKSYDANKNDAGIPVYINNAQISKVSGVWRSSSLYFWPTDGSSLTFFSYAPYSIKDLPGFSCNVVQGICLDNFQVASTPGYFDNNKDVLIADVAKDLSANLAAGLYYTTGVPTLFRHKLCTVQFLVSYANEPDHTGTTIADADKIEITSFTLSNIYTQGDFISNGWSNQTNVSNYANSVSSNIQLDYDFTSSPTKPVDAVLFEETMMIPQPTNAAGRANPPKIVIGYNKGGVAQIPAEVELYSPLLSFWDAGKKIVYRISISTKDEYITFNGSPTDWESINGGDINVGI